jgi:hypothetical protein
MRQSPASKRRIRRRWGSYDVGGRYQATTGEDIGNWEDIVRAVMKCRVCELVIAVSLLVVTIYKCSVNPFNNPKACLQSLIHVTICSLVRGSCLTPQGAVIVCMNGGLMVMGIKKNRETCCDLCKSSKLWPIASNCSLNESYESWILRKVVVMAYLR